jgi:hypothetical protein
MSIIIQYQLLQSKLCQFAQEIRRLKGELSAKDAEIAELRKNAERYRWLRAESSSYKYTGPTVVSMSGDGEIIDRHYSDDGSKLDNDIDAIIAAKKEKALPSIEEIARVLCTFPPYDQKHLANCLPMAKAVRELLKGKK